MDDVEEIKDLFVKALSDTIDKEIEIAKDENLQEALIITKDFLIRILENNPEFRECFKNIVRGTNTKVWI